MVPPGSLMVWGILAPNFPVGLVGFGFAGDLFPPQFVLRLSGAEEVGGQFRAAHVIEDLFALFQPFAGMDFPGSQPAI